MKIDKISFQGSKKLPRKTIKKLSEFGLNQKTIENLFPAEGLHFKNIISIDADTLAIDNIDRNLVKNNIWTAATNFYSPSGIAPYQEILLTKTEKGLKKSVFNIFLDTVKPYDGIWNSDYKAIRAMRPKREVILK